MKTLLQKLAVIITLIITYPSYQNVQAQTCGAGYTLAGINFDLQYFQNIPSSPVKFTFGKNEMRLGWSGSNTFRGSVVDHTGEGTSYGKGNDLKFIVGNGADTLTFSKEVSNLRYSIYDLDLNQVVVITAKNAAGTAQNITIVKDSTASTSQTITGSGTTSAKDSASSTAINLSNRGGTANVFIAGPVLSVTMTFRKSSGTDSIYISDISACNNNTTSGTFPNNYQNISSPETGQPQYIMASYGDSIVAVDLTNNKVELLYEVGNSNLIAANGLPPAINSLAYDPYKQIVYFADNARTPTNKSLYKYDVKTGVKSTWISDVTTLGIQLYGNGLGSGGAAFYDGDLYLGQDMINTGPSEPSTIYRIDIDANGNATSAARFWAKLGYDSVAAKTLYDWADFEINDGILYNFNSTNTRAANTGLEHIDMNRDSVTAGYTLSPTIQNGSQSAVGYNGTMYHLINNTYAVYDKAGNIGTTTTYTGSGSVALTDAAESFKYPYDFSDAPTGYGVAFHKFSTSPKLMLGTTIDYEISDTTNVTADADDIYNTGATNDEDGKISFPAISTAWYSYSITVRVTNTTGSNATLYGYIDFNRDGDFLDAGEKSAATTVPNAATTATVTWTGLTGGSVGSSFIRFRLASSAAEAGSPSGYAANGEVEDYPFPINQVNLPVEMVDFKGELRQDKTTLLTWSTASEMNNDYFDVQRKNAEGIWESLGQVQGSGNSNQLRTYTFIDKAPLTGENYYRLNQVDFGGKSELSSTIMVKLESAVTDKKDDYIVYPNPVRNDIWIRAEENIAAGTEIPLEVFNVAGEKVYTATMKENVFRIDLTQFQKGMYFIRIGNKSYRILKE